MSDITSILNEQRIFKTPENFKEKALINSIEEYNSLWHNSIQNPEEFWKKQAETLLHWHKPFKTVSNWQPKDIKWFTEGEVNVSYNCLDRHLEKRRDKPAIIWEGEPGDKKVFSYGELHSEVCKFSNVLEKMGIVAGDRITIYMPMIPEAAIAMLACTRVGAVHNVVFGGFSAEALAERNQDCQSKLVITADGGWRRGQSILLKEQVDLSLEQSPSVQKVIVVERTKDKVAMKNGRDFWWHELMADVSSEHVAPALNSEHPLFILYTSGSTGKPKGILHTTAGYLLGATLSSKYVFDLKENDVYWCTADVGWITGHSYIVYGPLSNGATILMYEGAPMYPENDRVWKLVEDHKVTIFYTAPTAIRAFMKCGDTWPNKHDLSSLRLLGTVGEPINPEAWMWYQKVIGKELCPIVDTWWQTETGSIMITPLPGCTDTVPGSATKPFLGIDAAVVDENGNEVAADKGGYLVIRKPWPSMLRTIYGNTERFEQAYFSKFKDWYFTGDGARKDKNGNFWILGRVDDVLNVSGHRLSTMEIESSLVSHKDVAEAAVVARPHDLKGECIVCFVTLEQGKTGSDALKSELMQHVTKHIGAIARPEEIRFADSLPKTRSGKIMRRLLRDIAAGRETTQDTTTLEDTNVLDSLRQ